MTWEKAVAPDLSDEEAGTVLFNQLKEETGKYPKAKFNPTSPPTRPAATSSSSADIDTFLAFFNALDYYAGLRQIELDKTPASRLEDGGCRRADLALGKSRGMSACTHQGISRGRISRGQTP